MSTKEIEVVYEEEADIDLNLRSHYNTIIDVSSLKLPLAYLEHSLEVKSEDYKIKRRGKWITLLLVLTTLLISWSGPSSQLFSLGSRTIKIPFVFFPISIWVFTLSCLRLNAMWRSGNYALASLSWPKTLGAISKASIRRYKTTRSRDDGPDRVSYYVRGEVEYKYLVGQRTYTSLLRTKRRVSNATSPVDLEQSFIKAFPVKQSVYIVYNPEEPDVASINAKQRWRPLNRNKVYLTSFFITLSFILGSFTAYIFYFRRQL